MCQGPYLSAQWFSQSAEQVATALIGCTLARQINGATVRGKIVETEAYEAGDPAMHLYRRKTQRNAVVFGPAGVAYVYRIYRQYHCFNIVSDRDEFASSVLIRAVHFTTWPSWYTSQKPEKLERIAAGPGKLCRALHIDESLKGMALHPDSGLWIEPRASETAHPSITQTTRIGLSRGVDIPWRWYLTDSPAVSKKGTPKRTPKSR